MTKTIIDVISDYSNYQEPKFLFGNADRTYLTIVTVIDMMSIGTPVVADGYEDEGDDCHFIGQVDSSWLTGNIDTDKFTL